MRYFFLWAQKEESPFSFKAEISANFLESQNFHPSQSNLFPNKTAMVQNVTMRYHLQNYKLKLMDDNKKYH